MDNLSIKLDGHYLLPEFVSTLTLEKTSRKPRPASASDVISYLKDKGLDVSRTTLFNYRDKGMLHVTQLSPKIMRFDLNEVDDIWTKENS